LRGDVAINAEASSGPNAQPHIPTSPKRVKIAVRLLQTSKEHCSAYDLVPRNCGMDNLGHLGV